MSVETATLVVDETWTLVSNATTGAFRGSAPGGNVLWFVGDTAPAAGRGPYGLQQNTLNYDTQPAKVYARALSGTATLSVGRVVDAANTAEVFIPSPAGTVSGTSFTADAPRNTVIGTITPALAGSKAISISPSNIGLGLSTDGLSIVRNGDAAPAGTFPVTVTMFQAKAANSLRNFDANFSIYPAGGIPWRFFGAFARPANGFGTVTSGNTRHKARFIFPIMLTNRARRIRAGWTPWQFALGNPSIVDCPNVVPVTKARVVLLASDMTTVIASAFLTKGGSRSFSIDTGVDEYLIDDLGPSDFGLSQFPTGLYYVEHRQILDMPVGARFPLTMLGTMRPNFAQSRTGDATSLPDDVDSNGVMNGSSTTFAASFIPFYIAQYDGDQRSYFLLGDSHTERTWDNTIPAVPGGADLLGGAGFLNRACRRNGDACFIGGIAGATDTQWVNATRAQALFKYANRGTTLLGTNSISGTMPGGAAGQPITVDYMMTNLRTLWSRMRSAGIQKITAITIPPRTVDNLFKTTDLANQTPVNSSATAAGGAPRDGYGWATGETRDLWNAALISAAGQSGGPDATYDLATAVSDSTDKSKWRVSGYSGTLTSAVAIGDTTINVSATVPQFMSMILNPGVSGVDPAVGVSNQSIHAMTVTGSASPFAIGLVNTGVDPVTGVVVGAHLTPAKTQTSGTTVKLSFSPDGIHLHPFLHVEQDAAIAPTLAA